VGFATPAVLLLQIGSIWPKSGREFWEVILSRALKPWDILRRLDVVFWEQWRDGVERLWEWSPGVDVGPRYIPFEVERGLDLCADEFR
jgi:hypothetical protein